MVVHIPLTTAQQPSSAHYFCNYITNYTSGSLFPVNLNTSLFSLRANAHSNRFYHTSTGQGPEKACSLFLCRGDISAELCESCIKVTSEHVTRLCPNQEEAVIWYDLCMLRYSNQSIFSVMEESPEVTTFNKNNVSTDPDQFKATLSGLMNGLVLKAKSSRESFAFGEVNYALFSRIYGLVQCTPDISPADCNFCLNSCVFEVLAFFRGEQGRRILKPSCNVRFEIYPFYESVAAAPAPSPSVTTSATLLATPSASLSPAPGLTNLRGKRRLSAEAIRAIFAHLLVLLVLLSGSFFYYRRRKARKKKNARTKEIVGDDITTSQSLEFCLSTIEAATNNFAAQNKIGEGGFGAVYKGIISNEEVAVKRLSKSCGQGVKEFKNEVLSMAKLQHRNLVKLLGFCLEGEEAILIYEFVRNKSLDNFLFGPTKQGKLDWSRRYKIIKGIVRGLLYLHEDSQPRVIHRDLKASNILLDKDANAKISDFGLAKIFTMDEGLGCTSRIIGTYGYMAPEYAMHGQFSVKSDVFSFGILILEIISGKKNNLPCQSGPAENLLSYAWKHWKEGITLELMDPTLSNCYSRDEAQRCIHIALLCVQEDPEDRPTMAQVLLMLNSFDVPLPVPRPPKFYLPSTPGSAVSTGPSVSKVTQWSVLTGSANSSSSVSGFEKS